MDRYAPFGADHQPSSGLITGVSSEVTPTRVEFSFILSLSSVMSRTLTAFWKRSTALGKPCLKRHTILFTGRHTRIATLRRRGSGQAKDSTPLFKRSTDQADLRRDTSRATISGAPSKTSPVKLVYENRDEKLGIARIDLNDRIAEAVEKTVAHVGGPRHFQPRREPSLRRWCSFPHQLPIATFRGSPPGNGSRSFVQPGGSVPFQHQPLRCLMKIPPWRI